MGRHKQLENPRVDAVYDFVVAYKGRHGGLSPTYRAIKEALKISSPSVVSYYVKQLIEAGKLKKDGHKLSVPGEAWSLEKHEDHQVPG